MLWIGLHLPRLSLEAFAASAAAPDEPIALLDAHLIRDANDAARQLGIEAGMKRATALALAPRLQLGQADARHDAEALRAVAHAALAFTPAVSLSLPCGVLLEVQASLRCFGGLEALLGRLEEALEPLGHCWSLALAPTAQAADLLARAAVLPAPVCPLPREAGRGGGPRVRAPDLAAVRQALSGVPVWMLGAGREHRESLQGMGLHTLADLDRLPRAGLARRFGEALLDEIDRAQGVQPDPRAWITLPPAFASRLELQARADTAEQVLRGAGVLLARLVAWARARHARVRGCVLSMRHEVRRRALPDGTEAPSATPLAIALAEPSNDFAHLQALLREQLARLRLAAPTLELELRCDDVAPGAAPSGELFPTAGSEREGLVRLVERLQARLGRERVRRLVLLEDHRPEVASSSRPGDVAPVRGATAPAPAPVAPRPVWLLPAPLALAERANLPVFDGAALQLLSGPERIETGWWDGPPVERDYYIAGAPDGALLWVYRARLPLAEGGAASGWFLQGRFG